MPHLRKLWLHRLHVIINHPCVLLNRDGGKSPDEVLKLLNDNTTNPLPTHLKEDLISWKKVSELERSSNEILEREDLKLKIEYLFRSGREINKREWLDEN